MRPLLHHNIFAEYYCNVLSAYYSFIFPIAPDKDLRSLGKYAPFFGELGINIFNWLSQYISVLFH